ncbi:ferrous iron transport protein B [Bacillus sp. 1P02SD]|uniref:ferrous iron transport protein B n=1 Tax=Bacillus sp. 1P02SD TaxID=3132264 RepID=UPI00399FD660
MQIALFGNPNTGKTSLFNSLTGSYEYVGNWSGVTVEKKVGTLRDGKGSLIDLPGVYTLNPISKDETVVTQFLLKEPFEEILNIVDASQLKRNLQLTVQLLEYGKPIVVGLNMIDVAKKRGMIIDEHKISKQLGLPVIPIIARTGMGVNFLSNELTSSKNNQKIKPLIINYGSVIEDAVKKIEGMIPDTQHEKRWLAIQYLEGNSRVEEFLSQWGNVKQLSQIVQSANTKLLEQNQHSLHQEIYCVRDRYIQDILDHSIEYKEQSKKNSSEKIDQVVTNRILGIPIFLSLMYLMFMLTFNWLGLPISDLLDGFFSGPLTSWVETGLNAVGASDFIRALILNGIISGVGGVLVFVPQIFILFFFISLLEDSGYMARVATVMDRIMQSMGLNGKAFIPMIIGFGCNVPGIMAARTVEQPKERLLTILLTPLMSCSARLPVYALFVGAFFAHFQALIVLSLYVLGIVLALLLAKLFSKTVFKNEQSFFIIELPPYRFPQWTSLWRSTWDKGKGFVRKAGTFIFAGSVFIWALSYVGPHGLDVPMDESFLAMIGGIFAPILSPLGFGTWQAGAALLTGFLAKEVVVASIGIIYAVPESGLQYVLLQAFTPVSAYSFMVFVLIYVPCLATVAVISKETGSKKLTLFSIAYALIIAYILSFVTFQIGSALVG